MNMYMYIYMESLCVCVCVCIVWIVEEGLLDFGQIYIIEFVRDRDRAGRPDMEDDAV